jgi:hypothetical protein
MKGVNMASIAISSATPAYATPAAANAKAAPAQAETTEKTPAVLKPDTVKLSSAAQAKMMHRAGQSPSLIAATLGTNVATVDGYLNIKMAVQAAATAAPAPAAQPAPTGKATPAAPTPSATSA